MDAIDSTRSMRRRRFLSRAVSFSFTSGLSLILLTAVLMAAGLTEPAGAAPSRYAAGPDAFGYSLKDSNEVDGPTYLWEDISASGTQVSGWTSTDDGYAGPIPIGFDFDYYGAIYDALYIGSNGYVSFGQGYGIIPWGYLPNNELPNNDIALFGGDMYLNNYGSDSSVYYQTLTSPDRFILQFDNLYFCCGQNTSHTFQLIVYPSGDILVQYNDLNGDSTNYVGIENADGTDGLSYGPSLADSLAIQYYYPVGVSLRPPVENGYGEPGTVVTYEVSLLNHTTVSDSFTVTLQSGNAWAATLSLTQTGTLSNGNSVDIELSVEIPPAATPGDTDDVTIEAISSSGPGTYTDSATFTTVATGGDLAYVAVSDHNYLALLDTDAGIVVDTVNLEPSGCYWPWYVAIPPDGQAVWVSCRNSDNVLVLDRSSNAILNTISGQTSPAGIAFTQDGAQALIGTRFSADVLVVDTDTFAMVTSVSTDSYPTSIVMHPYLPAAYAIHRLYDGLVSVIDTTSWTVVDTIAVGHSPHFATIARDGLKLYVSNMDDSSVSVVDTTANAQLEVIDIGVRPRDLDISPDGHALYVTRDWGDEIAIVDTGSNTVQETLSIDPDGHFDTPWGAELTCDGSTLAVTNAHNSWDTNSRQVALIETDTLSATLIAMPDANIDSYPDWGTRDIAICPQYVPDGVFLVPGEQTNSGARGVDVAHPLTLYNYTGITDTYMLALGSYVWPTTLSAGAVGPLEHGASADISATVTVPAAADWYTTDTVAVTASSIVSPTVYSDTATLTTEAYAPPEISIFPGHFSSSQLVGEIVSEVMNVDNGNGVDLFFELRTGGIEGNTLERILENLNQNFQEVTDAIPDRYDFSEGVTGDNIGDGGADMYDGGNYLSTNHGGFIDYFDDTIIDNSFFGVNGRYFTRKYPGLFVLVADMEDVDYFEVTGNLGADGSGSVDGTILQTHMFGSTYYGFVKRVYNAGDSSVNHLIIVADNSSADHTYSTNTDDDFHQVFNLAPNKRLYYLLYAGDNGYYIDDNAALNIMETFLGSLGLSPPAPWLSTDPISGTVMTNSSMPVDVIFDANGVQPGEHTTELTAISNDPTMPHLSLPVTMTVAPTAGMARVSGSVTDAWTGDPLWATVELIGVHTMTAEPDYTIWAPAGTYTLTASADGYADEILSISMSAGGQTIQDLALEPAQARLEHDPAAISVTAAEGTASSTTLTVANTGPVMLEATFHEMLPLEQQVANFSVDLDGRNILYDRAHGEPALSDFSMLVDDLTTAGATISENFTFPIEATVLVGYDVLWVSCCGYTNWTFNELSALADWLDGGGAILVQGGESPATSGPAGIYGMAYQSACSYGITTEIEDHPVTVGISEVFVDTCNYLILGAGSDVAVYDNTDQPHVVAHEQDGGKMVVIAGSDFSDWSISQADNRTLGSNVVGWLSDPGYEDIAWLSIDPTSITVQGHSTNDVAIHFDASSLGLGTHEAILAIEHNDPDQASPVKVPITLNVVEENVTVYLPVMYKAD